MFRELLEVSEHNKPVASFVLVALLGELPMQEKHVLLRNSIALHWCSDSHSKGTIVFSSFFVLLSSMSVQLLFRQSAVFYVSK